VADEAARYTNYLRGYRPEDEYSEAKARVARDIAAAIRQRAASKKTK
jgi:hypothetical protein